MPAALRRNRKGSDEEILRLNSLGLSLTAIGLILDSHPSSVSLRLKNLRVTPADTRRSFMDNIFHNLPDDYRDVVADLLTTTAKPKSIKEYVRDLLVRDVTSRKAELALSEGAPSLV